MTTMKAYATRSYGPDARFEPIDLPKPEPRPGELLVAVRATSLNPVDHKLLTGGGPVAPDLPGVLHCDVAGVVEAIGSGVTGFSVGDEVYGCAGGVKGSDGALADYMRVDAGLMARRPQSLSLEQSAVLPLVAITAWEAVVDRARLGQGDHVLIQGGTGGVGHIALQLAKWRGARVAATVSSEQKADLVRQLGADDVIDYRSEQPAVYLERLTRGQGFDVSMDLTGGSQLENAFATARNNGQAVGIVSRGGYDLTTMHDKSLTLHIVFMLLPLLTGVGREAHGQILRDVAELVDKGIVRPLIHGRVFKRSEINEAHALYASHEHIGKILIVRE